MSKRSIGTRQTPMSQPERKEVSAEMRSGVLSALRDPNGYNIYNDGRRYLRRLGFEPLRVVVDDLVEYLEAGSRLYELPDDPRKCQCCLRYEGDLVIYVKITPYQQSGTVRVTLGFHSHNTGYPPLPS